MLRFRCWVSGIALAFFVLFASPGHTEILPAPAGAALVTFTGKIGNTNINDTGVLDFALAKRLGLHELRTSTVYTKGIPTFRGVLMRDVLDYFDVRASHVQVHAIDGYSIEIPTEDFKNFDVLIAFEVNGKRLRVRDKGPAWIVYPRDQFKELQYTLYDDRWVWQINFIEAK